MMKIKGSKRRVVKFQFQNGLIKMGKPCFWQLSNLSFQFQNGLIKVFFVKKVTENKDGFQFQNGLIKVIWFTTLSRTVFRVSIPKWSD